MRTWDEYIKKNTYSKAGITFLFEKLYSIISYCSKSTITRLGYDIGVAPKFERDKRRNDHNACNEPKSMGVGLTLVV